MPKFTRLEQYLDAVEDQVRKYGRDGIEPYTNAKKDLTGFNSDEGKYRMQISKILEEMNILDIGMSEEENESIYMDLFLMALKRGEGLDTDRV
jgi:hypothetical protein